MRIRHFERYAVGIYGAAVLSGCISHATPAAGGPQGAMPSLAERAPGSWMERNASSQSLLYVAAGLVVDSYSGDVYVYTYPDGHLVGTLTGFSQPYGECTDSAGDVFVVTSSSSSHTIYEYAHGGTSPVATLSDPVAAFGCAVDPTTGNLAASGDGVAIFKDASGSPKMYYSSNSGFYYCGYDNKGNLYLSAPSQYNGDQAQLVRLAAGSSEFEQIAFNEKIYTYTLLPSVQWDGKYVTVTSYPNRKPVLIYRLRISGSSATVAGTTEVSSSKNHYNGQTWIQGGTIVGTGYAKRGYEDAFLWRYPAGGVPRRQIKNVGDVRYPEVTGVTVSVGESQ